jgi:uncharacterized protein YciI
MRSILATLFFVFAVATLMAQTTNPNYNEALAKKYGADDHGMKSYIMVILKTGSNKTTDKAVLDSCFAGHMKNISRLVADGKMVIAGPFGKNDKTYRGIFVLNVKTFDEANLLLQTDPTIKEKILEAELYNWYGSAALPAYLEASDKVWKERF